MLATALLLQAGCTGFAFATVPPDAAAKAWVNEAAHWISTGDAGQLWAHTCTQERQRGTQLSNVVGVMTALASDDGADDPTWMVNGLSKLRPHVDVDSLSYRLVTANPTPGDKAVAFVDVDGQIAVTLVLTAAFRVDRATIRMYYEEGAWKYCGVTPPAGLGASPLTVPAPIPSGR